MTSPDGRLDAMLSYMKAFDEEQRAKQKLANVKAALRRKAHLCGMPDRSRSHGLSDRESAGDMVTQ